MNRSEKLFAIATGVVAFAITIDPHMYEFGLGALALGAMLIFFFANKSAFRQHQYGMFAIWFGYKSAPKFTLNQVEARWAAIGAAICLGVSSGYLVQAFFG